MEGGGAVPLGRLEVLNELAGLFGRNVECAVLTETAKNADAWIVYLDYLQSEGDCGLFAGLIADTQTFVPELFVELSEAGVVIPNTAPMPNEDGEYGDEDSDVPAYHDPKGEGFYLFLRELLSCIGPMSCWRARYLSMTTDEILNEWCNEIEDALAMVALTWVSDEALRAVGSSKAKTENDTAAARRGIAENIESICQRMNHQGLPFEVDYFQIINAAPGTLDDELLVDSTFCEIERQLPYVDRRLLRESRESQEILLELHQKVDTLLSSDAAEMLSAKLEYCRPHHQIDA